MARRSRIPPMELQLDFAFDAGVASPGTDGIWSGYIDIAQCLSLLNRKFLRQGQQFFVETWSITANYIAKAQIYRISDTWVCTNAWHKALRTWLKSQEQLPDFDEIKGRYHDFKVFFDSEHELAGVAANHLPIGIDLAAAAGVSASAGAEWDASEIQIPNVDVAGTPTTVGYHMHMIGATAASKGIIEGYAKSRARPQLDDPNVVTGGSEIGYWMDMAFDDGDNLSEIRTDLVFENDSPPYIVDEDTEFEFYPGGSNYLGGAGLGIQMSRKLTVNPAVSSESTRFGAPFKANCGLLFVTGLLRQADEGLPTSRLVLSLNIAAGPAKGVMARPMQDVN